MRRLRDPRARRALSALAFLAGAAVGRLGLAPLPLPQLMQPGDPAARPAPAVAAAPPGSAGLGLGGGGEDALLRSVLRSSAGAATRLDGMRAPAGAPAAALALSASSDALPAPPPRPAPVPEPAPLALLLLGLAGLGSSRRGRVRAVSHWERPEGDPLRNVCGSPQESFRRASAPPMREA